MRYSKFIDEGKEITLICFSPRSNVLKNSIQQRSTLLNSDVERIWPPCGVILNDVNEV